MPPFWYAALLLLPGVRFVVAGHHGFSVHDDLLAFPQFQVVIDDSYISESDAQSKLDLSSSQSSARPAAHTPSWDHAVSVLQPTEGEHGHGKVPGDHSEYPHSFEYMILDSLPHLCSVPQVSDSEADDASSKVNPEEEAKESERARTRGSELIGDIDGPCLYYVSGWWSYSFCYKSEVRQFHQLPALQNGMPVFPPQEDKTVPSYVLGKYNGPRGLEVGNKQKAAGGQHIQELDPKATDLVEVHSSGNVRYLVQRLDHGTLCDLTGRPRRVEIQYHCAPGPGDKITSIKEISTCTYRMVIYTPRLCDDVAFQPPQELPQHQITCREIVPEGGHSDWRARQERKKMDRADSRQTTGQNVKQVGQQPDNDKNTEDGTLDEAKSKSRGPIIGGIELGGMQIVGKPGFRIEPPREFIAPAATAQGARAEIIVRFDPKKNEGKIWRMDDKRLMELGVSPDDIDIIRQMAEDMYKQEPNRRWRIVMADGENGITLLRPVIEEGIDLDEEEKKMKKTKQQDEPPATGKANDHEDEEGSQEEYFRKEEL